jgi:hypothetical protein
MAVMRKTDELLMNLLKIMQNDTPLVVLIRNKGLEERRRLNKNVDDMLVKLTRTLKKN